jgi:hypothetical protein
VLCVILLFEEMKSLSTKLWREERLVNRGRERESTWREAMGESLARKIAEKKG